MVDSFLFFIFKPDFYLASILPLLGTLILWFTKNKKFFPIVALCFFTLVTLPWASPTKKIILETPKSLYSLPQEAFKDKNLSAGTELLVIEDQSWLKIYLPLKIQGWLKNE